MSEPLQLEEGRDFTAGDGEPIRISAESFARISAAHAGGRAVELVIDEATIVVIEAPAAGARPGTIPAFIANG